MNKEVSKKKNIIATIIAAVIVAIIIGAYLGSKGSDERKEDVSQGDQQEAVVHDTYYNIGDTVKFQSLEFTVNSYSFEKYFSGFYYGPSNSGNKYCIINITIYNPSTHTYYFMDDGFLGLGKNYKLNFDLRYNESFNYGDTFQKNKDFLMSYTSIDPLESITASLCYEVPPAVYEGTEKLELKLKLNKTAEKETHIWVLRDVEEGNLNEE